MATDDAPTGLSGVSQKPWGMLPGIPPQGDSGRPGRRGIHFEPMIPGISLENSKNKIRRPGNALCLTPVDRGHKILLVRGT